MEYLVPRKNKLATHLWDGDDTYCRMFSTGGLRRIDRYMKTETLSEGRHNRFCAMCQNRHEGGYRG